MLINGETTLTANPMSAKVRRSMMKRPKEVLNTFDNFTLVPNYIEEIVPGDSVKMKMTALVRMNTPIAPVTDTAFLDQFFFFVPKRLVWDNYKYFIGEESNSYWSEVGEKTTPQIFPPAGGWSVGSMADHLGLIPGVDGSSVDALPFRAMALIFNEWFRDESNTQPIMFNKGDATVYASANKTWDDYVTNGAEGEIMLRVARFHDVFGSALRKPVVGDGATIPVIADALAPVVPTSEMYADGFVGVPKEYGIPGNDNYYGMVLGKYQTNADGTDQYVALENSDSHWLVAKARSDDYTVLGVGTGNQTTVSSDILFPMNLAANFSGAAVINVMDMRKAVAMQHVLERMNVGSRYVELIKNIWGITVPDARIQRPEFLGFKRIPINITEINQTSSTDDVSPLGTPGANSKSIDTTEYFNKSFCESGFLIGVCCVRNVATYAQGIKKFWRKRTLWHYYQPDLAGLSDAAIWNSELYWQSDSVVDDDTEEVVNDLPFGFAPCWYEYLSDINECHGLMRPQVNQSLAVWNYAEDYSELPTLSTGWLYPDGSNIRRTLAVQNQPDFRGDFYFEPVFVRPIPYNNTPGLYRL